MNDRRFIPPRGGDKHSQDADIVRQLYAPLAARRCRRKQYALAHLASQRTNMLLITK